MRLIIAIFSGLLPLSNCWAITDSATVTWASGSQAGQSAGTCSITQPDQKPLETPRTFVVGNDVPDGTEIFSWGYGEAFSDFIISCTSSGLNGGGASIYNPAKKTIVTSGSDSNGYILLSDSGFALKLWARFNTAPGFDYSGCGGTDSINCRYYITNYSYPTSTTMPPANTEIELSRQSQIVTQEMKSYQSTLTPVDTILPTYTGTISVRMALVKVGTIQYNGPLSSTGSMSTRLVIGSISNAKSDFLSGSGITIVPPACQLKTKDYTIPMGLWAADTINYVGSPAYGTPVPVNLSLECSGKVDHVRFRFEDTGTSVSANNNITLYDSTGGDKIDGLEIELQYNGSKANVNNTDLTDTGSHGSYVSTDDVFDSASTAAFTARYVQNGTITRNGANYTGPVTGKVNMYVTYD